MECDGGRDDGELDRENRLLSEDGELGRRDGLREYRKCDDPVGACWDGSVGDG